MKKNFDCTVCGKRFKDNYALRRHKNRKVPCTGVITDVGINIIQNPLSPVEKEDFVNHHVQLEEVMHELKDPPSPEVLTGIQKWFAYFTGSSKKKTDKRFHPFLETNKRLLEAVTEALSYSKTPPIENINKLIRRNKLKIRHLYPRYTPDEVEQAAQKVSAEQLIEQLEVFNDTYKKSKNLALAEDAIARIQLRQRRTQISVKGAGFGGQDVTVKQYIQLERIKLQNKKLDNETRKENLWQLTTSWMNHISMFIATFWGLQTATTAYTSGMPWAAKIGAKIMDLKGFGTIESFFGLTAYPILMIGKILTGSWDWILLGGLKYVIAPMIQAIGTMGLPGAVTTGFIVWITTYTGLMIIFRLLASEKASLKLPFKIGKIQLNK